MFMCPELDREYDRGVNYSHSEIIVNAPRSRKDLSRYFQEASKRIDLDCIQESAMRNITWESHQKYG